MILAVNIGNTNIRVAIGKTHSVSSAAFFADKSLTTGCFATQVEQYFGADIWEKTEGSIVSSVVPNQTPIIVETITNKTGKTPQRINLRICGELNIERYGGLIGEDRVVCCFSALQKYAPPLIVIDFGTATTINVVNSEKELIGGAILTGVQTGIIALSGQTAQLPRIDLDTDVPVIGRNTRENLLSGAIIGTACAVEGYVHRIQHELDCVMPVVITGGHASEILPYCHFEPIYEPDLLLDGLLALYTNKENGCLYQEVKSVNGR